LEWAAGAIVAIGTQRTPTAAVFVDEFDADCFYGALERKSQGCQSSAGTPSPPPFDPRPMLVGPNIPDQGQIFGFVSQAALLKCSLPGTPPQAT